jgi:serine/threonine protein phosphatase PrpC
MLTDELKGIQIESDDRGPGIADVEKAMADGFSTAGTLGSGLGAVNRLMHEFNITSRKGAGTHIVCRRRVREVVKTIVSCPLDFSVATRACPGRDVNGDDFIIKRWGEGALVGVIDGLGHGQLAHQAAEAARQYVETHLEQPLSAIFRSVGQACYSTRGVVMALARFDFGLQNTDIRLKNLQSGVRNLQSEIKLTFASVGNIEVRVFNSTEPMNFIVRRGIIGANAPNPVVTEHRWKPNCMMVLHSDGLKAHWKWDDFPELAEAPATVVAQRLLQRLARDNDDATVVVVRGRML